MPLPFSKSQIEKLGTRLISGPEVAPADLAALHRLLSAYSDVLRLASDRVRQELDLAATSRVKNTGTVIEKLHREGGSWLKSMHDLAGMRIVGDFDRAAQDEIVEQLCELFGDAPRMPRVIDRRAEPVAGYRAIHVVVFPDGMQVEIQVRTRRQHAWAELFEKLADRVGRGIRYGEPPAHWLSRPVRRSSRHRALYKAGYDLRVSTVTWAIAVANYIDVVEEAEVTMPQDPSLAERLQDIDASIASLRRAIEELGDPTKD